MAYNYTGANMNIPPELIKWVKAILADEYQSLVFQVNKLEQLNQEIADREARIALHEQTIRNLSQGITKQLNASNELNLATMDAINRIMSAHSNQP